MIKLSLDISTKATGIVLQKNNDPPIDYTVIKCTTKPTTERIKEMTKKIFEWIKDKHFDILIISKARHQFVNESIQLIEGMVLSEAIKKDIKYVYYSDVVWYSKMGHPKHRRPEKKQNSLKRFINKTGLKDQLQKIDCKYSGKDEFIIDIVTRKKIYKKRKKLIKCWALLQDGTKIPDDIADAFNAGDLYELTPQGKEV